MKKALLVGFLFFACLALAQTGMENSMPDEEPHLGVQSQVSSLLAMKDGVTTEWKWRRRAKRAAVIVRDGVTFAAYKTRKGVVYVAQGAKAGVVYVAKKTKSGWKYVAKPASAAPRRIRQAAARGWNGVKNGAGYAWNGVKKGARYTWNGVKKGARYTWNGAVWAGRKVRNGFKAVGKYIVSGAVLAGAIALARKGKAKSKDVFKTLTNGSKTAWKKAKKMAKKTAELFARASTWAGVRIRGFGKGMKEKLRYPSATIAGVTRYTGDVIAIIGARGSMFMKSAGGFISFSGEKCNWKSKNGKLKIKCPNLKMKIPCEKFPFKIFPNGAKGQAEAFISENGVAVVRAADNTKVVVLDAVHRSRSWIISTTEGVKWPIPGLSTPKKVVTCASPNGVNFVIPAGIKAYIKNGKLKFRSWFTPVMPGWQKPQCQEFTPDYSPMVAEDTKGKLVVVPDGAKAVLIGTMINVVPLSAPGIALPTRPLTNSNPMKPSVLTRIKNGLKNGIKKGSNLVKALFGINKFVIGPDGNRVTVPRGKRAILINGQVVLINKGDPIPPGATKMKARHIFRRKDKVVVINGQPVVVKQGQKVVLVNGQPVVVPKGTFVPGAVPYKIPTVTTTAFGINVKVPSPGGIMVKPTSWGASTTAPTAIIPPSGQPVVLFKPRVTVNAAGTSVIRGISGALAPTVSTAAAAVGGAAVGAIAGGARGALVGGALGYAGAAALRAAGVVGKFGKKIAVGVKFTAGEVLKKPMTICVVFWAKKKFVVPRGSLAVIRKGEISVVNGDVAPEGFSPLKCKEKKTTKVPYLTPFNGLFRVIKKDETTPAVSIDLSTIALRTNRARKGLLNSVAQFDTQIAGIQKDQAELTYRLSKTSRDITDFNGKVRKLAKKVQKKASAAKKAERETRRETDEIIKRAGKSVREAAERAADSAARAAATLAADQAAHEAAVQTAIATIKMMKALGGKLPVPKRRISMFSPLLAQKRGDKYIDLNNGKPLDGDRGGRARRGAKVVTVDPNDKKYKFLKGTSINPDENLAKALQKIRKTLKNAPEHLSDKDFTEAKETFRKAAIKHHKVDTHLKEACNGPTCPLEKK